MLIVIEGTDGTGKSTLADALATALSDTRCLSVEVKHFAQPEQHPLAEYELFLDKYRPGTGQHLIVDRLHWGEIVYGELYRGGSELTSAGWWHVEQYLRSRGAIMVHATGDLDTLLERQAANNEDFLKPEDADAVRSHFNRLASVSLQGVYRYDTTAEAFPGTDFVVKDLMVMGRRAEEMAAEKVGDFPSYVGPLIIPPDRLLVGEIPNFDCDFDENNHAAAFVPYNGCSGRYLIDALRSTDEDFNTGLVNAYDRGHIGIDLKQLWENLDEPEVVALGRRAEHHLSVMGVPHRHSHHPQYRRRFMHDEIKAYGRELVGG